MLTFRLSAVEVAERIDFPSEKWRGNCVVVVQRMKACGLVGPEAAVERMSPGPWPDRTDPTQLQICHDYLRLPDGSVIDPTRWANEGKGIDEAFILRRPRRRR